MSRPLSSVVLLLSLFLPASAALAVEIGSVDMQRVLEESRLGKRLQEQLRADFEPRGKALAEEEEQIRKLQQDLARDKPLMSDEQLKRREKEIEGRIAAYREKAMAIQQELMQVQQEKGREIIVPAREALNAIARKKKLTMVVERSQNGLLYIDESLDITTEVIKQLDDAANK